MAKKRDLEYSTPEDIQKFEIAIKHSEFAAEQLWQIFNIFILSHTILITLLGILITSDKQSSIKGDMFYVNLVLAMGLLTGFLWLGAYFRTRGYFDFRIAQASEIEPDGLKLLKNRGKNFAEGKEVEIEGKTFQMNCLAHALRMKWTMPSFIIIFIGFYIILLGHITFKLF